MQPYKLLIVGVIIFGFCVLSITLGKVYAQAVYPTIDSSYLIEPTSNAIVVLETKKAK